MVDVEKCPYIEYKIQGISGIVAKEEKSFCVKDDLIIQIELKQEGLEITGLKVLLKEDSVIDEQVKQTIRRKKSENRHISKDRNSKTLHFYTKN